MLFRVWLVSSVGCLSVLEMRSGVDQIREKCEWHLSPLTILSMAETEDCSVLLSKK